MPRKITKTAQSLYLEEIKGAVLDDFLAKGWYRMGPSIFSSYYIYYKKDLFSVIWLRTPLANYSLSKSLKKLNRKNKAGLSHTVEPVQYDEALEKLYQRYRVAFKGDLPESLSAYLMDSLGLDIYDTWLVKVYENKKLVACSIFDLGKDTLASIFGFYDPAYSTKSLGLYTMLLEIEFAQKRGLKTYYVGYFVPGNPRFDYKLRIGHIEYLDFRTKKWYAFDQFDYNKTPIKVIRRKLAALEAKLDKKYKAIIYQNAFIDVHIIEFFPMKYLEDPVLLLFEGLAEFQSDGNIAVATYDVRAEAYKLYHCQILHPAFSNYNPDWLQTLDDDTFKYQLVIKKVLKSCKTIVPIERWLGDQ